MVYCWWRKGFPQESVKWLIFYKLTVGWLRNSKLPLNWSFTLNLYSMLWKNLHQSWFSFIFLLRKIIIWMHSIDNTEKIVIRITHWLNGTEKNLNHPWPWQALLSDLLCVFSSWFLGTTTLLYWRYFQYFVLIKWFAYICSFLNHVLNYIHCLSNFLRI